MHTTPTRGPGMRLGSGDLPTRAPTHAWSEASLSLGRWRRSGMGGPRLRPPSPMKCSRQRTFTLRPSSISGTKNHEAVVKEPFLGAFEPPSKTKHMLGSLQYVHVPM